MNKGPRFLLSNERPEAPVPQGRCWTAWAGAAPFLRFGLSDAWTFRPWLAAVCLLAAGSGSAQPWLRDPYTSAAEKSPLDPGYFVREANQQRTRQAAERNSLRVSIPNAVVPEEEMDLSALPPGPSGLGGKQPLAAEVGGHQPLLIVAASVLAGILAVRKLGPKLAEALNTHFNPWELVPCVAADHSAKVVAEEEAFSAFLAAFQAGPTPPRPEGSTPKPPAAAEKAPAADVPARGLLDEFFAGAAAQVVALRQVLQDISREAGDNGRHKLLGRLCEQTRTLKGQAGLGELLPIWQMASALEGLLHQLTGKLKNVTPSTLRTVASAVDLLDALCRPGLKPDLLANPPVRLLAVDDEPISRHAVSCALKKAFHAPDLTENGAAAMELAARNHYDVIFLDVQMPGMDGFELCSKIHETPLNRSTPVVFITSQSDFNARANSTLSGGHDLIGKPFLAFEITVKALTLVLRGRLDAQPQTATGTSPGQVQTEGASQPASPKPDSAPLRTPAAASAAAAAETLNRRRTRHRLRPRRLGRAEQRRLAQRAASGEGPALRTHVSQQVHALSELLNSVSQTAEEDLREELLLNAFLHAHTLAPLADCDEMRPVFQVSHALEGLLKKLSDNPGNISPSTLQTAAHAVNLLKDLIKADVAPQTPADPPVRILVVDDDPFMRRAMSGALQVAFDKPESADGGQAALALATEKPFDVIFLDVCMPGLDGFAVCSKLRETATNRHTPVVFVTGQADLGAHAQSVACGGNDLIAKPFLAIEITLKALTFALRRRLDARRPSEAAAPAEKSAPAQPAEVVVPVSQPVG